MNKVINGKRYSTDKAECVGEMDNGLLANDFDYYGETLYRKRTGEFFVLAEGGARSSIARSAGSSSIGGAEIIPLSYDAAEKWAECHLPAPRFVELFGEPVEGDTVLNTPISCACKDKLVKASSKSGKTQREIIEELIGTI